MSIHLPECAANGSFHSTNRLSLPPPGRPDKVTGRERLWITVMSRGLCKYPWFVWINRSISEGAHAHQRKGRGALIEPPTPHRQVLLNLRGQEGVTEWNIEATAKQIYRDIGNDRP